MPKEWLAEQQQQQHGSRGTTDPMGVAGRELPASLECTPTFSDCRALPTCCTPGHTCFERDPLFAACLAKCEAGWGSCRVVHPLAPAPVNDSDGASEECSAGFSEDCGAQPRCCDAGFKCLEKDRNWSACLPSCPKGSGWSCREVAGTTGPALGQILPPPRSLRRSPELEMPSEAPLLTFYMYRAMSDRSYPASNVNVANLAGVLWYINHEVVTTLPRKFGINRIVRYEVQTRAPTPLFNIGMNFGDRYAFDSGQCTGGTCNRAWPRFGYFVGCNKLGEYPYPKFPVHYPHGTWYSLPGGCPSRKFFAHTKRCTQMQPGGLCVGPPTGQYNCTYSYKEAGQITLQELEAGAGNAFWQGLEDSAACSRRLQRAKMLFAKKCGGEDLPDPTCDFHQEDYFSELQRLGL